MTAPLITVLTPSYNRVHTLEQLAQSLRAQTFRNFEWLLIDDGSTDTTAEFAKGLQGESAVNCRYYYQNNGGKHRAVNAGIHLARGEYIFIVDSDDFLPPTALASIAEATIAASADATCAGIVGMKADRHTPTEPWEGQHFPALKKASSAVLNYQYRLRDVKAEVFKTNILREFTFPEFAGEKFVTEALVWNRIARASYTLLLLNKIIYLGEYRADGLSAQSLKLRLTNLHGTLLYYFEAVQLDLAKNILWREAANLARFCCHAGFNNLHSMRKRLSGKARKNFNQWIVFGFLLFIYDRLRGKRVPSKVTL